MQTKNDVGLPTGKASSSSTVFNLMNTVVGAGILALPYCFRENGIYATFAILPAVAVVAMFTLYLLSVVGESAQLSSLENVGFVLFGKWGRIMVELSIMGATFGAMTAYLVVIGDILTPFMEDITQDETMRHRLVVTLFPFLFAIVPLSLLKDFRALRFSSTASIVSVFTFAIVVVYEALKVVLNKGFPKEVAEKHPTTSSIIMTLPVFSFAFTAHVSLFPLYGELRNRSLPKIRWIIVVSVSLCTILYTIVGFSGYILFLDETHGDFLVNLSERSDWHIEVIRIFFAFSLIATYPVVLQPFRIALDKLMFFSRPFSRRRQVTITLVVDVVALMLAVFVPHITVVLGLTGATAMSMISYVIPGLFFLRIHGRLSWLEKFISLIPLRGVSKGEVEDETELQKMSVVPRMSGDWFPVSEMDVGMDDTEVNSDIDSHVLSVDETDAPTRQSYPGGYSKGMSWSSLIVGVGGAIAGILATVLILVHAIEGDIDE